MRAVDQGGRWSTRYESKRLVAAAAGRRHQTKFTTADWVVATEISEIKTFETKRLARTDSH